MRLGWQFAAILAASLSVPASAEPDSSQSALCPTTVKPGDKAKIIAVARCEAKKHDLPAHLVTTVIEIESSYTTHARGADGEVGLMQVMPPTARMLGFDGSLADLANPTVNIKLGSRYLAEAYRLAKGDLCTTLMKYRAGHGETRFSHLSVAYCRRARRILKREGIAVTGVLPKATFGRIRGGGVVIRRTGNSCIRRSFVPGPGYGRCLVSGSKSSARRAIALRRKIFQ
ncbi:MAG: lytic transglycosylase domain-containing protein [Rhizobiaceae bacterium]